MDNLLTYLEGFPSFLIHFGVSVGLTIFFAFIYARLTPHREWQLILNNVPAAAIAFGGSVLGFVIALASAVSHSIDIIDSIVWSIVALVMQLVTFFSLRFFIRDLSDRLVKNDMSAGIWIATVSLSIGILMAASLTY